MDVGLLIVLVGFGPLVLFAFLVRTRFSWLPGLLVMTGGCAMFAIIEPVHDDVGGIGALGNGVMMLAAMGLCLYGLVLLLSGLALTARRERRQATSLPVATVVAGATGEPSASASSRA